MGVAPDEGGIAPMWALGAKQRRGCCTRRYRRCAKSRWASRPMKRPLHAMWVLRLKPVGIAPDEEGIAPDVWALQQTG
eukprot:510435-Pyramimonas_sp.AAC.1